jgi:16S rRNA (adenine1518-N6/adenine1519-N6)-dimethyltransferase
MRKSTKILLKSKGVKPSKRMGQNFLISGRVLEKIIKAAELDPRDVVLEIGPGIGTLTKELAKKVKKVISVEKDPRMIEILKEILKDFKNVEVLEGDILKFSISTVLSQQNSPKGHFQFSNKNYKVVANLPYYITSPVIRMFLEAKKPPKLMVLMVQKEVGQRICAKPPKMSKLAVFCQFYGKPEIVSFVSKKSFWPQPKVDSAILKIVPNQLPLLGSVRFRAKFAKIVKAGFSQPRKQLINNFSKSLNLARTKVKEWLLKNNISPAQRAESLSLTDWINLAKTFRCLDRSTTQ